MFDLISFGAVAEHLYSPSANIERTLKWLKPGGIIHIEVPSSRYAVAKLINAYYWARRVNVTHISPMHPPFHLFEFSDRSFEAHGRKIGYAIAERRYWAGTKPDIVHRMLRPWMEWTNTGNQLTVWLRRDDG